MPRIILDAGTGSDLGHHLEIKVRAPFEALRFEQLALIPEKQQAIREFFEGFIAALPPQALGQFTLRSLRVQGDVAYITWSAGPELPLGTDTFVVRKGRIASQTFAMYAAPVN